MSLQRGRAGFRFFLFVCCAVLAVGPATLAQDADSDGILDASDNCVFAGNPLQANADADPAGNVCDCSPDESNASTLLSPAVNLAFSSKTDLSFGVPAYTGGGGLSFDLLRSLDSSNFQIATCVESNEANLLASDGTLPAPGAMFSYLVRADANCGGNLGADNQEARRSGAICPAGPILDTCVEAMDASCPSTTPACGANFSGGQGCLIEFIGNCYDTGTMSYKVTQAAPVSIDLTGGVYSLELFFANETAGTTGTMRFYDIDNNEIGTPLSTNGVCGGLVMPPRQVVTFDRQVRRIEVTASGTGDVWIDTFTVNPNLLATCTETMDGLCPDASPVCGGTYTGGLSCLIEFIGNCYDTGTKAYKVTPAAPLTIDFSQDVVGLDLFFANEVAGVSGTMHFFDAGGFEVDSPIVTNGVCSGAVMPPRQLLSFSRPVRKIDVTATGVGDVWVDSLTVNP